MEDDSFFNVHFQESCLFWGRVARHGKTLKLAEKPVGLLVSSSVFFVIIIIVIVIIIIVIIIIVIIVRQS